MKKLKQAYCGSEFYIKAFPVQDNKGNSSLEMIKNSE